MLFLSLDACGAYHAVKIKPGSHVCTLVLVKKKDGQTRCVTDLRELNKQTIKDSYPLTSKQEILT